MTRLSYRDLFDLPRDTAYFNAAQLGPMPRAAVAAGEAAFQMKAQPWAITTQAQFFDQPEALRAEAAKLFNASADDIAFVPAASYGLATAARNLTLNAGDEIVLLADQFPSNVYTWRALAQQTGAVIRMTRRSANQSWTEAMLDAIGPKTGLVACGAIHWIDGGRIDLSAVSDAARTHGAAFVLDLTQSLGVLPFDAPGIDPDFVVAAAYKWLLGPYSIGFLYVAPRHQAGEALEQNWINRVDAEDFTRLTDYRDGYATGARRFDMGERSNHQLVPATLESVRLLTELGAAHVSERCGALTEALAEAAAPFGFHADTPDRAPHYLALSLPAEAPKDLAAELKARDVHVSQRGPRLRVSPHIYNDEADIARFADALKACL